MTIIKKEHRFDFTDVLIWLGMLIIALWAIGKATGLIHSPVWSDMIPVFGALVTIAGISLKIGRILQKLDTVIDDVGDIKIELKQVDKRVTVLENGSKRVN